MKEWHNDSPTNRQIKVLRFFVELSDGPITKGVASGIIMGLFKVPGNREQWMKYVFLTGDDTQESSDLRPFDPEELLAVIVPDDWKPHGSKIRRKAGFERERLLEMATGILKEGVPFDDPVPEIEYQGRNFCCTGKFQFGPRSKCDEVVIRMGGCPQKGVTLETHYIIVGGNLSPAWANESYGNKIEKALTYKLEGRPVSLVAEVEWVKTLKVAPG